MRPWHMYDNIHRCYCAHAMQGAHVLSALEGWTFESLVASLLRPKCLTGTLESSCFKCPSPNCRAIMGYNLLRIYSTSKGNYGKTCWTVVQNYQMQSVKYGIILLPADCGRDWDMVGGWAFSSVAASWTFVPTCKAGSTKTRQHKTNTKPSTMHDCFQALFLIYIKIFKGMTMTVWQVPLTLCL